MCAQECSEHRTYVHLLLEYREIRPREVGNLSKVTQLRSGRAGRPHALKQGSYPMGPAQAEEGGCKWRGCEESLRGHDEVWLGQRSGMFPGGRGGEKEPLLGAGQVEE